MWQNVYNTMRSIVENSIFWVVPIFCWILYAYTHAMFYSRFDYSGAHQRKYNIYGILYMQAIHTANQKKSTAYNVFSTLWSLISYVYVYVYVNTMYVKGILVVEAKRTTNEQINSGSSNTLYIYHGCNTNMWNNKRLANIMWNTFD